MPNFVDAAAPHGQQRTLSGRRALVEVLCGLVFMNAALNPSFALLWARGELEPTAGPRGKRGWEEGSVGMPISAICQTGQPQFVRLGRAAGFQPGNLELAL